MTGFLVVIGSMIFFYIWAQVFNSSSPSHAQIEYQRKGCSNKLERKVFDALAQMGVVPYTQVKMGRYSLDFAVYGKNGVKIDIECDGFIFHNNPDAIAKDKRRDRYMKEHGWIVIRLPEKELKADFDGCMRRVYIKLYDLNLLPQKALTVVEQ